MIKNIIFDCGRVLIRFEPIEIVNRIVPEIKDKKIISTEIFETEVWQLLDKGVISKKEAYDTICSRLPNNLHEHCKKVLDNWYNVLDEIPDTLKLMNDLKNNSYNIYILSNFNFDFYKEIDNLGLKDILSGQIVSSEEKCLKPDKEIYLKLFEKYNLKPSECYFIDDKEENIEAGKRLGMDGFVFKDNVEELKNDLKNKSVNI